MVSENLIRVLSSITLAEDKIDLDSHKYEILKCGTYYDRRYGKFEITPKLLQELKDNFDANVLGVEIGIDVGHEPEKGAYAWVKELAVEGKSLFAQFKDYSEKAKEMLTQKVFKYFSVEYSPFETVKDGKKCTIKNVLRGIALTNRPVIKGMQPAFLSEDAPLKDYQPDTLLFPNNSSMKAYRIYADSLLAKEKVTTEDVTTLKAMFAELSEDEQVEAKDGVAKVEEKVEAKPEEKVEEKVEEKEVAPDAVQAAELKLAETSKELAELKAEKATKQLAERVAEVTLGEVGKVGISKTNVEKVEAFVKTLSDEQYGQFKELIGVATVLSEEDVSELGHGKSADVELSEEEQIDVEATKLAEVEKISYKDAYKKVRASKNQ